MGYHLIAGLPLVDAKNRAVAIADEYEVGMIMIEDDIIADSKLWFEAESCRVRGVVPGTEGNIVMTGTCNTRYGDENIRFDENGDVLTTGNVFTAVPRGVLARLPRPVFESMNYVMRENQIIPRGPNDYHHRSDMHFWHSVRSLKPRPEIRVIGRVTHLKHEYNKAHVANHHEPCEIGAY